MHLQDWVKNQEKKSGKKLTLKKLADKFGVSNGSIVRRWMLQANHKDFNFPEPENIINIQEATLGEVTPRDFYIWLEETKTKADATRYLNEK